MAGLLTQKKSKLSRAIVQLNAGSPNLPPIFLIHPVGGDIFCFNDLVNHLKVLNRNIYGVRDTSIDNKKFPYLSLSEMAQSYLLDIKSIQAQGPYYLCGYSFGGSIAVELAHLLEKQQEKISFIGLIDAWAIFSEHLVQEEKFKAMMMGLNEFHEDNRLIDLSWQRMKLLIRHTPSSISSQVVLFKAKELLEYLQATNDSFNGFKSYLTNIRRYIIPGNHNNLIHGNNGKYLANNMIKILDEMSK
jgi:thioesterase domain-containing protein